MTILDVRPWAVISGGDVTTYTDGDGIERTVHQWLASGELVVEQAGWAEILLVGQGSPAGSAAQPGSGARVRDGIHWLTAGTHEVGVNSFSQTFIGRTFLTVGSTTRAADQWSDTGAGGHVSGRLPGLASSITGTTELYGAAGVAAPRPNFGEGGPVAGTIGRVVVSVPVVPPAPVAEPGVWVKVFPPEPAGGGGGGIGWAALDGGAVTSYTDGDGVAWNVHTYIANGSVTVTRAGLARVLVVGGGSTSPHVWADGGGVWEGLVLAEEGASPVVVGVGATPALLAGGSSSALGARSGSGFAAPTSGVPSGQGAGWDVANGMARLFEGHVTTIRGTEEDFARGGRNGFEPRANSGDGRVANADGVAGIVILSVPA